MRAFGSAIGGYILACVVFAVALPPAWAVLVTVALTVTTGIVVLFGGCYLAGRRMKFDYWLTRSGVSADLGTARPSDLSRLRPTATYYDHRPAGANTPRRLRGHRPQDDPLVSQLSLQSPRRDA